MRASVLCILATIELAACSNLPTALHQQEKAFSIDSENSLQFHTVLYYPKGEALHYPGYVLALEKSPRNDINGAGKKLVVSNAKYLEGERDGVFLAHNTRQTIDEFQNRDRKSLFISHIIKYDRPAAKDVTTTLIDQCFLYNSFEAQDPVDVNAKWEFKMVQKLSKDTVLDRHGIAWRRCPLYQPEQVTRVPGVCTARTRKSETAVRSDNVEILRNQYQSAAPRNFVYINGLDALKKLECGMASHLREERYSHVVIIVMGWNTSQDEAIRNFNDIIGNMVEAARQEEGEGKALFRPLVVGVTWPSMWTNSFANVFSYPNKADDADEVGLVWLNIVVNRTIPQLLKQVSSTMAPKVVLIGHSFGARAAMRALFSGPLLAQDKDAKEPIPDPRVDLVVALQGAVSINRFDPEKSWEGAPYRDFQKMWTQIVMTAASGDGATSLPFWYSPSGAASTWKKKCGDDASASTFECMKTVEYNAPATSDSHSKHLPFDLCFADDKGTCPVTLPRRDGKLLYIDTSAVVTTYNSPGTGGGAHSDIYRMPMGALLWKLTEAYAPNPLTPDDLCEPDTFEPSAQMYKDCTQEAELLPPG
ncbi:alpha/beta hydrolase [Caballeronia novacaledonica]|uniref:Alpha/beta hydrolase family protein n=1 Tax=Caballeronia novacaledonica TaxID=1544861 RepID=A0AA37IK29_9BURK|nr:alpha/beta hydrolase [Caballeronia novacaledonica]GJH30174.1 hypothetical protein CBA19CS42_36680 [Caballeronia novacaledonica]